MGTEEAREHLGDPERFWVEPGLARLLIESPLDIMKQQCAGSSDDGPGSASFEWQRWCLVSEIETAEVWTLA